MMLQTRVGNQAVLRSQQPTAAKPSCTACAAATHAAPTAAAPTAPTAAAPTAQTPASPRAGLFAGMTNSPPPPPAARAPERVAQVVMSSSSNARMRRVASPSAAGDRATEPLRGMASGAPLPAHDRQFMEDRFGTSFGAVRVHGEAAASQAARAISARAFTLGSHVYLRDGAYTPGTEQGRHLLAHELAHVVQAGEGVVHRYAETTEPASRLENVALDVGEVVLGPAAIIARRLAAKACLEPLFAPMHDLTFDRWIPHACTRAVGGRLHAREWDAFGHCWIGCEGTRRCGERPTADLGMLREVQRELQRIFGSTPHDSFSQDVANQAVGRALAYSAGTCYSLCDSAHSSRTLDLSAPVRTCYDCADPAAGEHPC